MPAQFVVYSGSNCKAKCVNLDLQMQLPLIVVAIEPFGSSYYWKRLLSSGHKAKPIAPNWRTPYSSAARTTRRMQKPLTGSWP